MKRIISILLVTVMFFSCTVLATAYSDGTLTQEQWDARYDSLKDENTLPTLNVGATEGSVSLCWHAPLDTEAKVQVSKNENFENAKIFNGETTESENEEQVVCRVTIDGLEENTEYFYRWNTGENYSDPRSFKTKSFTNHKALVIGDIQIGGQTDSTEKQSQDGFTWNNVLATALKANPDVAYLLSPGDNTSTGKQASEWQTLLMAKNIPEIPIALAIGNHDKKGFTYNYFTNMPNEYYGEHFEGLDRDFYFVYGDTLYLFFDATSGSAKDHMAVAQKAIKEYPDTKWRIGVMHQALFGPSYGALDPETMILLNAVFTPIFDNCDLDLVLTGHAHQQGRSHFLYQSSVISQAKIGKTYTDPLGAIYLNSNAICDHTSAPLKNHFTAYHFVENDVTAYTTLEFVDDEMRVKTFRGDNNELLDYITIKKTKVDHKDSSILKTIQRFLYKIVELLGLAYMRIDAVVVEMRGGHF